VVLVRRFAHQVDLDPDCVLNGLLEFTAFNLVEIGGFEVPRAMLSIVPVLALSLLFVAVFWKELLLSSFDPGLATAMGFRAGLMHYLLMALVALTTVASFEQVGSILVIAMLIVPGATAHLLCERLGRMLATAAGIAIVAAVAGHFAAVWLNTNTAGTMAAVVGLVYLATVFFAPRQGIVGALLRNLRNSNRVLAEDVLALLYRLEELAVAQSLGPREAAQALGGGPWAALAVRSLLWRAEVRRDGAALRLTDAGRAQARRLVRAHRLWEAYLVERLGLPLDHVHEPAMRMEHYLDEQLQQEIAEAMPGPPLDPHGRPIPDDKPPP
jgi:manganese/zinc/iron transport system permease protein